MLNSEINTNDEGSNMKYYELVLFDRSVLRKETLIRLCFVCLSVVIHRMLYT